MKRIALFALGSVLLVGVFVLATRPVASASGVAGLWDAVVVANKVDVPFRFEIAQNGARWRASSSKAIGK